MIYLDNNATTALSPAARQAWLDELDMGPANPSSPHMAGAAAAERLEGYRRRALAVLGGRQLIFTGGATEANLLVLYGMRAKRLVISDLEHSSIRGITDCPYSIPIDICKSTSDGRPDLECLESCLAGEPALVSVMYVNNETGIVFPIEEVARRVHERGGILHVDAVQGPGKTSLLPLQHADVWTFSAHKFHGPLGVGGIVVNRPDLALYPMLPGGRQEQGVRSGTINLPAIAGAVTALEEAVSYIPDTSLRDRLEGGMPQGDVVGLNVPRIWNTSFICYPGLEQDDLIAALSARGIAAGAGAACTDGLGGSRVLKAMGIPPLLARSAVRYSLSRYTTADDIDTLLERFPQAWQEAAAKSPYGVLSA